MKALIFSETAHMMNGQGVHTAYVDLVELLRGRQEVDVLIENEGKGDVFHSHTYGPLYFWKGRKYKSKRVITVHVIPDSIKGSLPFWKLWYPFVKWYFKKVFNYADICIAISPMVEKAILDLGVKTKIVRIANPLPIGRWQSTYQTRIAGRKRLQLKGSDFMILGVGQLQSRKGVEDFIEIAKSLPDLKFVWVGGRPFGKFTEGYERINKKIANAPANLHFTGLLDLELMPEMYAAADVMLFPSYQENCPLAPIEAAACGMPVIYRDIEEYVQLYEFPYLKADSNDGFIEIIKRLSTDEQFYEEGLELSSNIIRQFEKEEIYRKIMDVYSSLLKDSKDG